MCFALPGSSVHSQEQISVTCNLLQIGGLQWPSGITVKTPRTLQSYIFQANTNDTIWTTLQSSTAKSEWCLVTLEDSFIFVCVLIMKEYFLVLLIWEVNSFSMIHRLGLLLSNKFAHSQAEGFHVLTFLSSWKSILRIYSNLSIYYLISP